MYFNQLNEHMVKKYYNVKSKKLLKYNKDIIQPYQIIKDHILIYGKQYQYGAFITITISKSCPKRIVINKLGQLIKYTNELLFSKSVRKKGIGIKGCGTMEKQINGNVHFHLLLEYKKEYGEDLSRLQEKLKNRSEKFDNLFNYDEGFCVDIIKSPVEVMDYIIKNEQLHALENFFFIHPEGTIGLQDDGCIMKKD